MSDEGGELPPNPQRNALVVVLIILGVLALLGVVGVGILAALLAPALSKARDKANTTRCANNLRQLGIGAICYSDDKRVFPHVPRDPTGRGAIELLVKNGYIDADPQVLACPCDPSGTVGYEGFVHAWSMNVRSTTLLAWDRQTHPDGKRNVLMADASVVLMTEPEFQQALGLLNQQVQAAQAAAAAGQVPGSRREEDDLDSQGAVEAIEMTDDPETAKILTESDLEFLSDSLQDYKATVGSFPAELRHLWERPPGAEGWEGPYVAPSMRDPWGQEYALRRAAGGVEVLSWGADGAPGGEGANADLVRKVE